FYISEDCEQLQIILRPGYYHAVVGNPPYINVKDGALNSAYRERYISCHEKYALTAPFIERSFNLGIRVTTEKPLQPGYVGIIVGKGFMRQQFGVKLVEQVFPRLELTHV